MARPNLIPIPGFRPDQVGSVGRTVVAANTAEAVRNAAGLGAANSVAFAGGTFGGNVQVSGAVLYLFDSTFGVAASGGICLIQGSLVSAAHIGGGFQVRPTDYIGFSPAGQANNSPADVRLHRGGPGILQQRNGTNGQISEIYKSFTSDTNFEALRLNSAAVNGTAKEYRLEIAAGSLGGAVYPLRIGGLVGTTFTPWLSFAANGNPSFFVLPTSDPAVAGAVWRSGNDLKISTG